LSSLGQKAEDISTLLGKGTTALKEPMVLRAFQLAIRDGLVVAVVFAAISLMFAMALPWPRLKGGITDHRKRDRGGVENNEISTARSQSIVEAR